MEITSINRKLSISEMAQIHDISRQTLIYYDKIGLFRPAIIEKNNGYRYYSSLQIPLLREICFLRSIGVPLDEIRRNNEFNNSESTIELLESQNEKICREIDILKEQQKQIEKRVKIYRNATDYANSEYRPTIQYFPERRMLYHEWKEDDRTHKELHFALMKIWNLAEKHGILPSKRWGALIFKESIENGDPLKHAGGCCMINHDLSDILETGYHVLAAGEYACMPKFGMPYETQHIYKLLRWVEDNDYEIVGDIYDECLMDSIFYDDENELDFCELQIPIRKKGRGEIKEQLWHIT